MESDEKNTYQQIKSELTQETEISLTFPALSQEKIDQIQSNLRTIRENSKNRHIGSL